MHSFYTKSTTTTTTSDEPAKKTTLAERLKKVLDDKRGLQKAVPIDLGRYLNESQLLALHSLESFGWHLSFVRRASFTPTTVVVANPASNQHAVLEEDGSVNLRPAIELRIGLG